MSSDGGRGNKGAQRRRGERDRRRPATYSEADNSDEWSEEEDKDESGEFEEEDERDESSARGKRGGKKEKPLRQGTRVSSRDKGSRKVDYKLGGEDEEEEEDDDEMVLDDDESEQDEAEESEDELSIQDEGGKEIDVDLETNSDEEGASNEDEGQRKPVDENVHLNETRPQDMHNRVSPSRKKHDPSATDFLTIDRVRSGRNSCARTRIVTNLPVQRSSRLTNASSRHKSRSEPRRGPRRTRDRSRIPTSTTNSVQRKSSAWTRRRVPGLNARTGESLSHASRLAPLLTLPPLHSVFSYHYTCLSATLQKNFRTKLESEHARSDRKHKKRVKVELDPYKVLSIRKCTLCEKPSGTHCCGCTKPGKQITECESIPSRFLARPRC